MEIDEKTPLKRPISFSDDSYEWDSIRDDVPADDDEHTSVLISKTTKVLFSRVKPLSQDEARDCSMGWNSLKCEDDTAVIFSPSDFSVEWVPSGHRGIGGRSAKRRKIAAIPPPAPKPKSEFTCELLLDKDKEIATNLIEKISNAPGNFEFESSTEGAYARLVPFPSGVSVDRSPRDMWQLDGSECNMETLLSGSSTTKCRDIKFAAWGNPQRKARKFETLHVNRSVKLEDLAIEDGDLSWSGLEHLIKRQFVAMEPNTRYTAAKHIIEILSGRSSFGST